MSLNKLKKIKSLSKTNRIYVSNGKAHFCTDKHHFGEICVTINTDMVDGTYTITKNELITLKYSDVPEMNMGIDLDTDYSMIDVKGIPYDIVNYVRKGDDPLAGIYFDIDFKCVVATDGRVLYSHNIKDIPASILIRSEFWKLMHHFNLTQVYFDNKVAIAKGEGVTIISNLITHYVYPSWFHCVPRGDTHIEITDTIKETILKALKILKPYYTLDRFITFDGTDIKVVSSEGCAYKVGIGVELFPDKVITFDVGNLKQVLKIAQGYINIPRSEKTAVTITSGDTTSLIMPLPLPDYSITDATYVEFEV